MRKAWILVLLFPLLFCFCQKPRKTLYTIGIVQLIDSPTANETRKGLIQALEDGGLKDGVNVQLKIRNGMGTFPRSRGSPRNSSTKKWT